MKTKTLTGAVLGILLMLTAPVAVLAHEGHEHHVMGTVSAIDALHVKVTTKDGKTVSLAITPETKVFREKAAAKLADVKVGGRIMVETDGTADELKAVSIQLGTEARREMKKELKKK